MPHQEFVRFYRSLAPEPLPAARLAPQIGLLLGLSLKTAAADELGWSLTRLGNGQFNLRTWKRARLARTPFTIEGGRGKLYDVLAAGANIALSHSAARAMGLPVGEAEESVAGALLLALFAADEPTRICLFLEFCPWGKIGQRHRLRYLTVDPDQHSHYHFIHAPTFEATEMAAIAFLARAAGQP
jgi:hypothetical protein